MGRLVKRWANIPIPVVPPVINPEGIIKNTTPAAYKKLPAITISIFNKNFVFFIKPPRTN